MGKIPEGRIVKIGSNRACSGGVIHMPKFGETVKATIFAISGAEKAIPSGFAAEIFVPQRVRAFIPYTFVSHEKFNEIAKELMPIKAPSRAPATVPE